MLKRYNCKPNNLFSMKVGLLEIDATFGSLNIHFDNLVGGGDFGEVVNQVLALLGKNIWDLVIENKIMKILWCRKMAPLNALSIMCF